MMECSLNTVRRRSLYYFIKLKYAIDYFVVSDGNIVFCYFDVFLDTFRVSWDSKKEQKKALGGRKKSEEARGEEG